MTNPDNRPPPPEVIEVEATPIGPGDEPSLSDGGQRLQTFARYEYEARETPSCCSGCGCLALAIVLTLLFNFGDVASTALIVVGAGWLSVVLLKLVRVSRTSEAYVYLLVPLFLGLAATLSWAIRGRTPLGVAEVLGGTAIIYAAMLLSSALARRRTPRRSE